MRHKTIVPKLFCLIALSFFIGSFFIIVPSAQAADKPAVIFTPIVTIPGSQFTATVGVPLESSTAPIINYIKAYYGYAIAIVGIVAAIMLMLGGIIWITSQGNSSKIEEAKGFITSSIIGLFLVLGAYTILGTVNTSLVNIKPTKIQSVEHIETITCCGKTIQTFAVTTNDQGQKIDRATKKPVSCEAIGLAQLNDNQLCIDTGSGYQPITKGQPCGASGGYCFVENPKPIGWTSDLNENCPSGQYCYYHDSNAKLEGEVCGYSNWGTCKRTCDETEQWITGGSDCGNDIHCCAKTPGPGGKCGTQGGTCMNNPGSVYNCPTGYSWDGTSAVAKGTAVGAAAGAVTGVGAVVTGIGGAIVGIGQQATDLSCGSGYYCCHK
ncbi:MAG: pilin [Candidatus Falkowbacteria bacterium]